MISPTTTRPQFTKLFLLDCLLVIDVTVYSPPLILSRAARFDPSRGTHRADHRLVPGPRLSDGGRTQGVHATPPVWQGRRRSASEQVILVASLGGFVPILHPFKLSAFAWALTGVLCVGGEATAAGQVHSLVTLTLAVGFCVCVLRVDRAALLQLLLSCGEGDELPKLAGRVVAVHGQSDLGRAR